MQITVCRNWIQNNTYPYNLPSFLLIRKTLLFIIHFLYSRWLFVFSLIKWSFWTQAIPLPKLPLLSDLTCSRLALQHVPARRNILLPINHYLVTWGFTLINWPSGTCLTIVKKDNTIRIQNFFRIPDVGPTWGTMSPGKSNNILNLLSGRSGWIILAWWMGDGGSV